MGTNDVAEDPPQMADAGILRDLDRRAHAPFAAPAKAEGGQAAHSYAFVRWVRLCALRLRYIDPDMAMS
jgi:hypothetical protein